MTERAARGCRVLFTAGSVLRGDDAAGPLLAKLFQDEPLEGWEVVDGGQTPEDDLYYIRELQPTQVVFVDAAEMRLEPGQVRRLTASDVADQFLLSTHSLPMTFLLGRLAECCDDVVFLGIQVQSTEFFDPLAPAVRDAVERIAACLREGADTSRFETMS
ncbi:hydrogenase maturation peptidase HycI [Eggerthellaceae bacterium zg-1084]|uniref:hydrogenase maturation peptidase HycI n=1 Tax=Berryella wangjianweii TaxID=2734634 RepID=UPI0015561ACF|nr:hydrogenase maturation peptidase HycI [Berryella wangjianweii]NPD30770.1 hydrogenase maturation peptidase HycI [Berryella wangjianweii]NPD32011.1 hydrogenase maturation peptidase HycI [Eggerthellaceae bacterium zg-997]